MKIIIQLIAQELMNTSKMSKLELLEKCKNLGITKCSSKNKSQLIQLINEKINLLNNPHQIYQIMKYLHKIHLLMKLIQKY